jgi:hypothetical protein
MDAILNLLLHSPTTMMPPGQPLQAGSAPPEEILTADSRTLFEVWQGWRGDRLLPRRADVDLAPLGRLMPRLALLEARSATDIVFRLAGTELERLYGRRLTGESYVTMVAPDQQASRGALLWRIAQQPCSCVQHAVFRWQSGQRSTLEIFGLPILSDRAGEPLQFIAVVSHLTPRGWKAPGWGEVDPVIAMDSKTLRFIDIGAGLPVF